MIEIILPGQGPLLHSISLMFVPLHVPPFASDISWDRVLSCVPLPQLCEQEPNSTQSPLTQSTIMRRALKKINIYLELKAEHKRYK